MESDPVSVADPEYRPSLQEVVAAAVVRPVAVVAAG
jgi:hypothetical protein